METNNNNNNNNNNSGGGPGGVISYVGSCGGSPTRTSPVSMYSDNSDSQPCFPSSSSSTQSFLCSGSGSAGEDGSSSSSSSSAGGSPRGRDDSGSLRASPSNSVSSLTKLSGMVLLCKVCGDVASGFHYGVHACEGCKGFFRRSIQQNIQYKKCAKNQSCTVLRTNRNRCQQCRFKKCLSVGMSRDAVRFGRIPKREKQKMLAEMQNAVNNMVDERLQSDFQMTSLGPPASSPCPGVAVAPRPRPQPPALPLAPSSPSPTAPASSSPPLATPPSCPSPTLFSSPPPSPGVDSTISAVARAHRETFLYAHDKLSSNHTHRYTEAEQHSQPNGYHGNALNTIFNHNHHHRFRPQNNMDTVHYHHHSNGRRSLCNRANHLIQGQNCPMRKRPDVVLACPMNLQPHADPSKTPQQIWEDFSLSFTPAVKEVVEFAKHIPGFAALSHNDQVTLLKAGTFEVLMVRFSSMFNMQKQTVTFMSGTSFSLDQLHSMGMSHLLGAMFDFSHKLGALELNTEELGLFTAVVLVSADRSGIENVALVEQLQESLIRALRSLMNKSTVAPGNRMDHMDRVDNVDSPRFTKLLLKLPDLRTLNNMHSEKLLSFRIDA